MKDIIFSEEEKNLEKNIKLIDKEIKLVESLEDKFLNEADALPSKDKEYRQEYKNYKFEAENNRDRAKELKEIRENPYFAHMSFDIVGEGKEDIYIGDKSLIDSDVNQIVCDWRAEIPSLYYLNQKSYEYNSKKYEIIYKRKIDIKHSKLQSVNELRYKSRSLYDNESEDDIELMEDDNNMICDEFLQNKLKEHASSKEFKDIISTIQANQYKIITADRNRNMIVQGVAGSGKTAIILHRLSYLFYNYKDIKPQKTIYISPSTMLIDNMDSLSIKLGIDKIKMMTLKEYYLDKLNSIYQKKFNDIKNSKKVSVDECNRYGDEYYNKIYNYINKRFENEYNSIVALCKLECKYHDRKNFSKLESMLSEIKMNNEKKLSSMWNSIDPLHKLGIKLRLSYDNLKEVYQAAIDKQKLKIDKLYYDNCVEKLEKAIELKSQLENAISGLRYLNPFRSIDVLYDYYCDYVAGFDDELADDLRERYQRDKEKDKYNGVISRLDTYCLLRLAKDFDYNVINQYDYAYIDEAQDYNDNEVLLIQKLENNCVLNVYGDVHQNIYPNVYKKKDWIELEEKMVGKTDIYTTNENYRNPKEIVDLCKKELNIDMQSININSNVIQVKKYKDLTDIIDILDNESIIICNDKKSSNELKKIYTNVYTVYEVKGMEYANVTVIEDEKWTDEMKYIAYTRSLNALTIFKKEVTIKSEDEKIDF